MTEPECRNWIRDRIQAADPALWVIESKLACSPRPLRYHSQFGGRIPSIPAAARPDLERWLAALRSIGIGTIVVLVTPGEMRRYAAVVAPSGDLVSFYESERFVVHAHPIEDPAHAAVAARPGILGQLQDLKPVIFREFEARVGAMLVHCSGGMDRTSPIGAYIANRSAEPSAPASKHGFTRDNFEYKEGVLSYVGYRVGRNGLSEGVRLQILNCVFHNTLPRVESPEYMEEWGTPETSERLQKLAESIAAFTRNANAIRATIRRQSAIGSRT